MSILVYCPCLFSVHVLQVKSLQKNNEDAKTVNKEIASTLESVMQSHSQLQTVVENLQTELGKKDTHITRLKNEKYALISTLYISFDGVRMKSTH